MSFKSPPGINGGQNIESPPTNTANKNMFGSNAKKANEAKNQRSFLDQLVESANADLKQPSDVKNQKSEKQKRQEQANELDYLFGECDQDEPFKHVM